MIPPPVANTLGPWLRNARLATRDTVSGRPLTQAQLAALANMSTSKIAMLEREEITALSPDDAHILARVLSRPESEIVEALGFDVGQTGLTEDERELLAAFRRLRSVPILQSGALSMIRALPATLGPQATKPRRRSQPA